MFLSHKNKVIKCLPCPFQEVAMSCAREEALRYLVRQRGGHRWESPSLCIMWDFRKFMSYVFLFLENGVIDVWIIIIHAEFS